MLTTLCGSKIIEIFATTLYINNNNVPNSCALVQETCPIECIVLILVLHAKLYAYILRAWQHWLSDKWTHLADKEGGLWCCCHLVQAFSTKHSVLMPSKEAGTYHKI